MAAIFGLLAVFDRGVPGIDPDPLMPSPVTAALTPIDAKATLAPRGARIEPSGRLTILEAPPTQGTLEPPSPDGTASDMQPRSSSPVAPATLAGIRGFYRLGSLPREEQNRLITITLEQVHHEGRLLLVDGCFRFGTADGPLLVFAPDARLGLHDGFLMVGQKGMPARYSARVGEAIAWEGKQVRGIDDKARAGINKRCGSGEVISVPAWSASVQAAAEESRSAALIARDIGGSFEEAKALMRRCGEPARRAVAGGPLTRSVEDACAIARPTPIQPPPPPDILPSRR